MIDTSSLRQIVKSIALGFLLLAAGIFIVEVGLRLYYRHPIAEQYYRSTEDLEGYGLQPLTHYEYLHHGRRVLVSTNADGNRIVPGAPDSSASVLYVVGDSQTFGWGLSDNETIPAVLQRELGASWRVVNLGVPGYGPFAYGNELLRIPDDGDALVLQAEVNDFQDSYFSRAPLFSRCGYLVTRSWLGENAPCFILSSYALARTMELIIDAIGDLPVPLGYHPYAQPAARVLRYRIDNIYQNAVTVRRHAVTFAVVPWDAAVDPSRLKNYTPVLPSANRLLELPDDFHADEALFHYSKRQDLFQANDSHLTATGAEVFAKQIAQKILSGPPVSTSSIWPRSLQNY